MSMRVGVRNISNACVSRKMRESWKVCLRSEVCPAMDGVVGLPILLVTVSG